MLYDTEGSVRSPDKPEFSSNSCTTVSGHNDRNEENCQQYPSMFFYYVSLRCDEYAMNIYRQLKNSSEKHVDIFWASWSSPEIHRNIILSSICFRASKDKIKSSWKACICWWTSWGFP